MGGDRVFIHCHDNEDVWQVFNNVVDFFGMHFRNLHKWTACYVGYERGAWLRVYGTPVHAWNTNFFKLCVSKCGRFIQADECTVDKGRLDYARILISTSSLEVLNTTTELLVDGCKFTIKLVEEWGCCLGEDAFLTEEGSIIPSQHNDDASDNNVDIGLEDLHEDVHHIMQDITKEWGTLKLAPILFAIQKWIRTLLKKFQSHKRNSLVLLLFSRPHFRRTGMEYSRCTWT